MATISMVPYAYIYICIYIYMLAYIFLSTYPLWIVISSLVCTEFSNMSILLAHLNENGSIDTTEPPPPFMHQKNLLTLFFVYFRFLFSMENSKACKFPFKIIHFAFIRWLSFKANFCRLSSNPPVPSSQDTSQQYTSSRWDTASGVALLISSEGLFTWRLPTAVWRKELKDGWQEFKKAVTQKWGSCRKRKHWDQFSWQSLCKR